MKPYKHPLVNSYKERLTLTTDVSEHVTERDGAVLLGRSEVQLSRTANLRMRHLSHPQSHVYSSVHHCRKQSSFKKDIGNAWMYPLHDDHILGEGLTVWTDIYWQKESVRLVCSQADVRSGNSNWPSHKTSASTQSMCLQWLTPTGPTNPGVWPVIIIFSLTSLK